MIQHGAGMEGSPCNTPRKEVTMADQNATMEEDSLSKTYKHDELPLTIKRQLFIKYGVGKWNAGRIMIDDLNHPGSESFETVQLCSTTRASAH